MGRIVVLGSFINDLVVNVNKFPVPGESLIADNVNSYLGGKGINQCVAIARLNGDVEMIGMVGNDSNGEKFLKLLEEENIKHDHVFISNKSLTGMAQIQTNNQGQNQIVVCLGANNDLDISYLDEIKKSIDECKIFLCQFENKEEITYQCIKYAKEKGKVVIVNPAPAHYIPKDILKCIDYLTPNETELAKILNQSEILNEEKIKEYCKQIIDQGTKNVIVTLGSEGCYLYNKDQAKLYPGYKVKAVDTVAAGDSFNGALATKLLEKASLEEAIKFANGMGALTVQTPGAIPSIKRRDELERFLKENII